MNVAELRNLHPVQSVRKIRYRDFNAPDLIVQSFGGESIHRTEKRGRARNCRGSLEKMPAARVSKEFGASRGSRLFCLSCFSSFSNRACSLSPCKLKPSDKLYKKEPEKCAGEPHSDKQRKNLPARNPVVSAHAEPVREGKRADPCQNKADKARNNAQWRTAPV